jgi:hypothetical protein
LALGARLAFCSLCRFCRMRGHAPPRLRRCPPKWGFLARIWASRFASGALVGLIADLEAPWRKTPTLKKPRDRHTLGGSAEGAGGLSSHSAKPATRSPPLGGSAERSEARGACSRILHNHRNARAKNRPTDARSAPLLRRSRNTGGPRTSDSEGRGGREGRGGCRGRRSRRMPLAKLAAYLEAPCSYPRRKASNQRNAPWKDASPGNSGFDVLRSRPH